MTDSELEQRVRDAAPPMTEATRSVWPAVQERLRPRRSRVRPLLWAGAGLVAASLCVAQIISSPLQPAPLPMVSPRVPVPIAVVPSVFAVKHVHHVPRHKQTLAVRTVRPHPSHIAYTRPLDTTPPMQTPVPNPDAPRVQSATLVRDHAPQNAAPSSLAPRAVPHVATGNAPPPKPVE